MKVQAPTILSEIIFDEIDRARMDEGWGVYTFAKKCNFTARTYYSWEKKRSAPSVRHMISACLALCFDPGEFLSKCIQTMRARGGRL